MVGQLEAARLLPRAPVNAPFSWPNSSLSTSVSGRAAQLKWMNGACRRGEIEWRMRATSPLPVPLSPRISTVELLCATFSIICLSSTIARLLPIIEPRLCVERISLRSDSFSSLSRWREASSSLYSRAFSIAMAAWSAKASRNSRSLWPNRWRDSRWST